MTRHYRVRNSLGVHARPAAEIVKALARVPGPVAIEAKGRSANGKSILEVMSLGIRGGETLALTYEDGREEILSQIEIDLAEILSVN